MPAEVRQPEFPPRTRAELAQLGWDECDVILVAGDAYVDHPSFGTAVIARVLIDAGFRTGIITQPRWDRPDDFQQLGRPRLFFGVTAGNVDSMVNHYSPLGQQRRSDAYSPGGRIGLRPNRATIVYCSRLRAVYPGVLLVLGGIEASLRRLAHYDYWDNAVRRSILLDAKADIIAYGMAEKTVVELARSADSGDLPPSHQDTRKKEEDTGIPGWAEQFAICNLQSVICNDRVGIPGTVVVRRTLDGITDPVLLPSDEEVKADKAKFLDAFMAWSRENGQPKGRPVAQKSGDRYVVQFPPPLPLTQAELDHVYALPYQRRPHPGYTAKIPALETVKFSITSHRGCLGSCSFCALTAHQGRIIQWRSKESIVAEAVRITRLPDFKGHITDVGGPTANMYGCTCDRLGSGDTIPNCGNSGHVPEPCRDRECLFPEPCPNLKSDYRRELDVLAAVRSLPGVKKVSIGTGLRYDLLDGAEGREYQEELCRHYVSGQLRIAPEHVVPRVLTLMRKTAHPRLLRFIREFEETNRRLGLKQYLIPYFISGFPGCTLEDMVTLAEEMSLLAVRYNLPALIRQVQDFTPTPMTLATAMYYTGIDPFTGAKLEVARDIKDKKLQRAILQLREPKNRDYVERVLLKTGRKALWRRLQALIPESQPTTHTDRHRH